MKRYNYGSPMVPRMHYQAGTNYAWWDPRGFLIPDPNSVIGQQQATQVDPLMPGPTGVPVLGGRGAGPTPGQLQEMRSPPPPVAAPEFVPQAQLGQQVQGGFGVNPALSNYSGGTASGPDDLTYEQWMTMPEEQLQELAALNNKKAKAYVNQRSAVGNGYSATNEGPRDTSNLESYGVFGDTNNSVEVASVNNIKKGSGQPAYSGQFNVGDAVATNATEAEKLRLANNEKIRKLAKTYEKGNPLRTKLMNQISHQKGVTPDMTSYNNIMSTSQGTGNTVLGTTNQGPRDPSNLESYGVVGDTNTAIEVAEANAISDINNTEQVTTGEATGETGNTSPTNETTGETDNDSFNDETGSVKPIGNNNLLVTPTTGSAMVVSKDQASKVEDALRTYLGIDSTAIKQAIAMYFLSRATGASHVGAMRWAGNAAIKNAGPRVAKEDKIKALIEAGNTPESVEAAVAANNVSLLVNPVKEQKAREVTERKFLETNLGKLTIPSMKAYLESIAAGSPDITLLEPQIDRTKKLSEQADAIDTWYNKTAEETVLGVWKSITGNRDSGHIFSSSIPKWFVNNQYNLGLPAVRAHALHIAAQAAELGALDKKAGKFDPKNAEGYLNTLSFQTVGMGEGDDYFKGVSVKDKNEIVLSLITGTNNDSAAAKAVLAGFKVRFEQLKEAGELPPIKPSKGETQFSVWLTNILKG